MTTGDEEAGARRGQVPGRPARWAALALLLLAGCAAEPRPAPIRPEQDLHHPDPRRRTQAVQVVARERRPEHVPDLIELLDDEDPAVRMVAGATLSELTGRDTGYRAFASAEERRAQVRAWRAWHAGTAPRAAP
jgi:HEAT repeat protein